MCFIERLTGHRKKHLFAKTCLIMKLMAVFLLATCMQVSAKGYSQQITMVQNNASLKTVFREIERQSGYQFFYKEKLLRHTNNISLSVSNMPIEKVLDRCLSNQPLTYTIIDKIIVIKEKKEPAQPLKQEEAQVVAPVLIRGVVKDEKGGPLPGVSVVVRGSQKGTSTGSDGSFTIEANTGDVLDFSIVGYKKKSLTVNESNSLTIQMEIEVVAGSEVVVIGYGTQRKANLTGAVSQIKMDEVLGDRPVINTTSALQGSVPGLQITRVSTPGQNNNAINIRGPLSINGGSPLVLIDNVPGDLSMLNPEDVESVTVLKDAASAAIYGARAAGGVIIVTTKRPKSNTRFQMNYNNNFGSEKAIGTPVQASLDQYLTAYINAGFSDKYWASSQSVSAWRQYLRDYGTNPSAFNLTGDGIYVDSLHNIYYLHDKNLYDNFLTNGLLQSHNVSVSGGTATVRYRMSGGYNSENGPLITNKDFYKRFSTSAYVSADLNKWFTQEVDIKYAQATTNIPTDEAGGLYSLRLASYYPEGNMPGSLMLNTTKDVPLFTPKNIVLNANTSQTITNTPRLYFKSILKPLKGLEGVFEYTYNKSDAAYSYYSGKWTYSTIQLAATTVPNTDYLVKRRYFTDYNALNAYLTYTKSFGDHNFKLLGGAAQESSYYEYINNRAEGQALTSFPSFNGASGTLTNQDDYSEYAIQSLFYRANYNFRNKYLVELNGRYDGSSKFPPHHRFGFFPSASVGWQIGREHFMDRISKSVNELKVRASYGTIGNQNINPYAYAPSMAVSRSNVWAANNDLVTVLGVPALVSDNFTWESVTSADAGVDFALFHSRLQGVFDWYQRDTRDMLSTGSPLPAVVGAAAPLQNTASMRTRGFEIALNWNDRIGNVKYRLGVNLYNSSSWITKYTTNTSGLLSDWYVGKRIGEIWGYVADGYYSVDDFENLNTWKLKSGVTSIKGINVRPGDVKYKNLMDDANSTNQIDGGVSTLANPGDTRIIGNTTPKYQYGVNAGVNYKGLDLNIMLQGIGKRDYWLSGQSIFPFAGSGATDAVFQPLYYNQTDYWTPKSTDPGSKDYLVPVNPNPKYFRIYNQMENVGSNTRVSNKYLQNASYLRIKNVTLSYTLPQTMLRRTGISALRFFISAENLATFTSLPKGYDPEPVTLQWTYPFYRTISGGLNVTL